MVDSQHFVLLPIEDLTEGEVGFEDEQSIKKILSADMTFSGYNQVLLMMIKLQEISPNGGTKLLFSNYFKGINLFLPLIITSLYNLVLCI